MRKRFCLVVAMIALLPLTTAVAQSFNGGSSAEERAAKHTERMVEKLDLDNRQADKVGDILLKYGRELEALRAGDGRPDIAEVEAIFELQDAEMARVLDSEQFASYQEGRQKKWAKKQEKMENRGEHRGKGKGSPEQRAEWKKYKSNEMNPVLLEQRQKLEAYISPSDQALINDLRATRDAHKAEMKAMKGAFKGAGGPTEAQKNEMRAMKEAHRADMQAAKPLLEKYGDRIKSLMGEIEDERAEWKEDRREIFDRGDSVGGQDRAGAKAKGDKGGDHHKAKKALHFLLMDPSGKSVNGGRFDRETTPRNRSRN